MTLVKKSSLFAASLLFTLVSLAQTTGQITHWLDEPPQFLFLYQELEALTGESIFVDMLTVDSEGKFNPP